SNGVVLRIARGKDADRGTVLRYRETRRRSEIRRHPQLGDENVVGARAAERSHVWTRIEISSTSEFTDIVYQASIAHGDGLSPIERKAPLLLRGQETAIAVEP